MRNWRTTSRYTPKYQELYKRRKETIERVFADAKEKHAMRYTQYRGLAQQHSKNNSSTTKKTLFRGIFSIHFFPLSHLYKNPAYHNSLPGFPTP